MKLHTLDMLHTPYLSRSLHNCQVLWELNSFRKRLYDYMYVGVPQNIEFCFVAECSSLTVLLIVRSKVIVMLPTSRNQW